jgi:hypothetical protein
MPKVGTKTYDYTAKGKKQAQNAAKRMGTKVNYGSKKKG